MKDKNYLYEMYNATSTDDGKGDLETYKNWLERQLLSRIERLEQLDLHNVSNRRELLIGYAKMTLKENYSAFEEFELKRIDEYLANL